MDMASTGQIAPMATQSEISAAIIVGLLGLVAVYLQYRVYANALQKEEHRHKEKIEAERRLHDLRVQNIELLNSQEANRQQAILAKTIENSDSRIASLERLWNAVSLAKAAATAMVMESGTADVVFLVERTTKFMQQIVIFLNEVKLAPSNLSISREDVRLFEQMRDPLVRLFLSLDIDAGNEVEYRARLGSALSEFMEAADCFENHVRMQTRPSVFLKTGREHVKE